MTKTMTEAEYQALAEKVVKSFREIPDFGYSGDLPLGRTWGIAFGQSRDSGLMEQSNFAVISADMLKRFRRDVQVVRFGHWAVGWVENIAVKMLDRHGRVTPAARAIFDWKSKMEDYPVADDEDYSQREYDAAADWIKQEGRGAGLKISDAMASEIFRWLGDNDPRQVENIDDQGAAPSIESIQAAIAGIKGTGIARRR